MDDILATIKRLKRIRKHMIWIKVSIYNIEVNKNGNSEVENVAKGTVK